MSKITKLANKLIKLCGSWNSCNRFVINITKNNKSDTEENM